MSILLSLPWGKRCSKFSGMLTKTDSLHYDSILEVLKMLKEQEARDYQREHRRNEEAQLRMELERDRHAMEIENVRAELREWEAKREELAAASIKDPENQEGIDTIIALLKDQMAYQEKAMANLKDSELKLH